MNICHKHQHHQKSSELFQQILRHKQSWLKDQARIYQQQNGTSSDYYMGLALKQWSVYLGNVLLNFIHKECKQQQQQQQQPSNQLIQAKCSNQLVCHQNAVNQTNPAMTNPNLSNTLGKNSINNAVF